MVPSNHGLPSAIMRFTTPQDTGNRMLHHKRIECTALYIGVPNVNGRDGGHPPFRVVRIRLSVMPCGVVTVVDALHIVADAEDFPMVAVNREGKERHNGIPHNKKRDAGGVPGWGLVCLHGDRLSGLSGQRSIR